MPVRFPTSGSWKITNASDKEADVFYVENISFDERGYAKLSPRMVRLYSDNDDNNFGVPLSIGRMAQGEYQVATDEANWQAEISDVAKTFTEDTGTSNPATTLDTDAAWFQGLWHVSTDTAVLSRPVTGGGSQAYTSRITGLTSGVRHIIKINQLTPALCISNGNTLNQYQYGAGTYTNTTNLTIPTDFEISGVEYNNSRLGIITRLANNGTKGQDQDAVFFIWDGALPSANIMSKIGSDAGIAITAYGTAFLIITRSGELRYWNGGGFQTLAVFPFFKSGYVYGDALQNNALGNVFMRVIGDTALVHIGNELSTSSTTQDKYMENFPAGVWCFDQSVGLYHRYSLSNSPAYVYTVTSGNIDTSTDVLTISSGTVPATGNVARLVHAAGIGGVTMNVDYYIIKASATTFKLAETREHALAGVSVDITSASAGSNYFLMVDHKDYGTTRYDYPGAVAITGNNNLVYTDIVAGGRIYDTDSTTVDALCIAVPHLENRGVIVFPKLFAPNIEDMGQSFVVRYRPLGNNDAILVKVRTEDVYGLPISNTGYIATWTGQRDLYTSQNLSAAKDYFDAGGTIEMHIIAGSGAGVRSRVTAITEESGTYALTVEDTMFGVIAGEKCYFQLSNWETVRTITSADDAGYVQVTLDAQPSKFVQIQLELRGDGVTIEDAYYINSQHK